MCFAMLVLMWSMIAASVVDLPEPVVPVNRMIPRSSSASSLITGGSSSSSIVLIWIGIARQTIDDRAALAEGVDAEAREARDGVGEVDLVLGAELGQLGLVGEHVGDEALHDGGRQLLASLERLQPSMAADHRACGNLQVEVRALQLDELAQGLIEIEHPPLIGRGR